MDKKTLNTISAAVVALVALGTAVGVAVDYVTAQADEVEDIWRRIATMQDQITKLERGQASLAEGQLRILEVLEELRKNGRTGAPQTEVTE